MLVNDHDALVVHDENSDRPGELDERCPTCSDAIHPTLRIDSDVGMDNEDW